MSAVAETQVAIFPTRPESLVEYELEVLRRGAGRRAYATVVL